MRSNTSLKNNGTYEDLSIRGTCEDWTIALKVEEEEEDIPNGERAEGP